MTLRLRDLLAQQGDPLQLEVLTGDVGLERPGPPDAEVASPGLALAGYTGRFVARRLHVLGETEITYLASLEGAARHRALEGIFAFELPVPVDASFTQGRKAVTIKERTHIAGRLVGKRIMRDERLDGAIAAE